MVRESFPAHITIIRIPLREFHTNYPVANVCVCVGVCGGARTRARVCVCECLCADRHYSRQLDSPKRLYVREAIVHAPFDMSSNVITYIIGRERAMARRTASYSHVPQKAST